MKSIVLSSVMLSLSAAGTLALQANAAEAPAESTGDPQETAPASPDKAASPPTLESLQAELRTMQARHEEDLRQLREEQTLREAESLGNYQQEAADKDRLLRIYGFADVGVKRTTQPDSAILASTIQSPTTFYLGRLNLYFDSQPDPDFRFLAETRLTLYPNGSMGGTTNSGQVIRTSTSVVDTSSPNPASSVNWSGMVLERAVMDWKRYDYFSVRVGLFLSPFGIYNVDHGTPTLISTLPPAYISWGWIPERQLGVQIFGSRFVKDWELGYAATVGNGRTDGIVDLGDKKGFGGRLLAKRKGDLRLQLGISGIYQPYRRDREQFGLNSDGGISYTRTRTVESNNLSLGADLSLDYEGLRIRSEFVYFKQDYTKGKRDQPLDARGGYSPDLRGRDWFLVVAYRMWKLEPFAHSELFLYEPGNDRGRGAWLAVGGLNAYLRPNVILKSSWAVVTFLDSNTPELPAPGGRVHSWNLLLTWAF